MCMVLECGQWGPGLGMTELDLSMDGNFDVVTGIVSMLKA